MYPLRERRLMARFIQADREWADAQAKAAGYTTSDKRTLHAILDAVDDGAFSTAENAAKLLFDAIELLLGHALVDMQSKNEDWVDLRPGDWYKGTVVRVRPDAYETGDAKLHNGRRGRVSRIANGQPDVTYEDGTISSHSPAKLQKLA